MSVIGRFSIRPSWKPDGLSRNKGRVADHPRRNPYGYIGGQPVMRQLDRCHHRCATSERLNGEDDPAERAALDKVARASDASASGKVLATIGLILPD